MRTEVLVGLAGNRKSLFSKINGYLYDWVRTALVELEKGKLER